MHKAVRYNATLVVAIAGALVAASLFFPNSMVSERFNVGPKTFWLLAGVFSLLALLSLWGYVGIWFSSIKTRAGEIAEQKVVISKKSWHYRLYKWVNFGESPPKKCSECEYWAGLVHGLVAFPPIYAVIFTIVATVLIVISFVTTLAATAAWLVGLRPNNPIKFLQNDKNYGDEKEIPFLKGGYQLKGPIVLGVLLLAGLVATLVFTDAFNVIQLLERAPWMIIGKLSLISVLVIAATAILFYGVKVLVFQGLLPATKPLRSVATARVAGVCRGPVEFAD